MCLYELTATASPLSGSIAFKSRQHLLILFTVEIKASYVKQNEETRSGWLTSLEVFYYGVLSHFYNGGSLHLGAAKQYVR